MTNCKHCGLKVFLKKIGDDWVKFEDQNYTIAHILHKSHTTVTNNDHLLLTKTITRLSQLEKKFAELEKKDGGVNNEI